MSSSLLTTNFVYRLSRDRAGFATTLDILKFICKEVWTAIWDKQVDNLRTNHRGVYVLQDNVFKPLLRVSLPPTPSAAKDLATITKTQLAFPVGIIRGALARLGVHSTVVAETAQIPQCKFSSLLFVICAALTIVYLLRHLSCQDCISSGLMLYYLHCSIDCRGVYIYSLYNR